MANRMTARVLKRALSLKTSHSIRILTPETLTITAATQLPNAGSQPIRYLTQAAFRPQYPGASRGFHTSVALREVRTVVAPPFADSVSEGDVRWEKAVGDEVAEDDLVGEIETDKTSLPLTAPAAGVIEALLVEDGATVTKDMPLFKIRIGGAGGGDAAPKTEAAPPAATPAPPTPSAATPPSAAPPTAMPPPPKAGPIPTTPPPVPVTPTLPLSTKPTAAIKPKAAPAAGLQPIDGVPKQPRTETRERMTKMRKKIAQRLKDAQNTCAMLTTFNEIDMTNIMAMRKQHQEAFVKIHGIKVGFMSAFVAASAAALSSMPNVNAVIDGDEIVYRDYVDISVAVATPKGLVVPVIRDADSLDFAGIEKYIAGLGEKARNNALAVEDMDGGTFTISNGGVFGSLMGTPIINPPQSAILGMHGVFDRPVAMAGKVEIRPMMYVALTYDHRLIDGREAVTFLRKVKTTVEDPRVLLLGL